jgi:hypothetical protein
MIKEIKSMIDEMEMVRVNTTIQVEIKQQYGQERIYPLNYIGELGLLTGQKTINRNQINALKKMGFKFEVKATTL